MAKKMVNGFRLRHVLPNGEVLNDIRNNKWIIGSSIGCGSFGDIYNCRRRGDQTDEYAIKVDNTDGPLFQEMNFYMRVANERDIKRYVDKHKLKTLGMPRFIATGIHNRSSPETDNEAKRFLVMDRFGDPLEKLVKTKTLTITDAIDIAVKMIDVLEYIHSFGYIHADIKDSNIVKSRMTRNDWYLIDFGLAERYCDLEGIHYVEKPNIRRANNGTAEYRSRDAHIGLLSRRSDIECLGYNLIEWLNGTLPWINVLRNAKNVEELKKDFFKNLDQSLRKCFKNSIPDGIKEFLSVVDAIKFNSKPNYNKLKDILLKKELSQSDDNSDEGNITIKVKSHLNDRTGVNETPTMRAVREKAEMKTEKKQKKKKT